MIISTFLFGIMNVLIKYLSDIPSYEVVLFRSAISLVITFFMLKRAGVYPFGKSRRIFLLMRGLAGSTALLIFFYTLQNLPLATAVTVQYTSPIFTIILAAWIVHEPVRWQQWFFFFLSFCGILMIRGLDPGFDTKFLLLGLLGAAFSGIAYNAVRKVGDAEHALVVVFYLPLSTLPIITPYCATHWVMPHGSEWLLLLGVGITTQFAQLYMTRAYQMEKAGSIANYAYLGIVFALLFGYFFFHEHFSAIAITGMGIVIFGILLNFLFIQRVTNFRRFRVYIRNFPGL